MKKTIVLLLLIFSAASISFSPVFASLYNQGIYNEDVPYGSATYISINTDGDVSLAVTPTSSGSQVTGANTVTVTSTDVIGYKLYLRSD